MTRIWIVLAALGLAACSRGAEETYVFRSEERPSYDRSVAPSTLDARIASGAALIDVRLAEDKAASPEMIPGARYQDPEQIASWAEDLDPASPVIVYCVKGKWVSQKAAAYLAGEGFEVYNLEGGIEAWRTQAALQRD